MSEFCPTGETRDTEHAATRSRAMIRTRTTTAATSWRWRRARSFSKWKKVKEWRFLHLFAIILGVFRAPERVTLLRRGTFPLPEKYPKGHLEGEEFRFSSPSKNSPFSPTSSRGLTAPLAREATPMLSMGDANNKQGEDHFFTLFICQKSCSALLHIPKVC